MKVGLLAVRDVVTAEADETLRVLATRMIDEGVGSLVVVERDGERARPLGIVTDRDLVRRLTLEEIGHARALVARDLMTQQLVVAREDEDSFDALERMRARGVRRLPVVDHDGSLVALLTFDDLVAWMAEELGQLGKLLRKQDPRARALGAPAGLGAQARSSRTARSTST
jgi:CBS domain-containing protein